MKGDETVGTYSVTVRTESVQTPKEMEDGVQM
jgi:hypothetical protein